MFWATMWPRPDATTDLGEMFPSIVLARRIRRSGLGLPAGRVVFVVGAAAGRREVAGATDGAGSRRAAVGARLSGAQPTSTTATTTKPKIRRIRGMSGGTTPQDAPQPRPDAVQAR
ncbi:MAG TPA: hypothetical protein VGW74_16100 [Propionibacteriaceae bacterium]|nr:hypothetical protein [Propionibacteriaceae bacterium]